MVTPILKSNIVETDIAIDIKKHPKYGFNILSEYDTSGQTSIVKLELEAISVLIPTTIPNKSNTYIQNIPQNNSKCFALL